MKTLIITLATLVMSMFVANAQECDTILWPVEAKTEYVRYMLDYEEADNDLMGETYELDPSLVHLYAEKNGLTEEEANAVMQDTYEEVEASWRRFVWLCNEERINEAIAFYRENRLMVDIALANSIVRFTFHDEVIGHLIYDVLPLDEARTFMCEVLKLDCAMLETNITSSQIIDEYNNINGWSFNGKACISEESMMDLKMAYLDVVDLLVHLYTTSNHYMDAYDLIQNWGYVFYSDSSLNIREAMIALRKAEIHFVPILQNDGTATEDDYDLAPWFLNMAVYYLEKEVKSREDSVLNERLENVRKIRSGVDELYSIFYGLVD